MVVATETGMMTGIRVHSRCDFNSDTDQPKTHLVVKIDNRLTPLTVIRLKVFFSEGGSL